MMDLDQAFSPTTSTDLELLPLLLRNIQIGDLRVPAFQRGFVWTESRVCELFRSIHSGYPIGSMLFLKTNNKSLKVKKESHPFPASKIKYPTHFVIDGMQRLSSLYGVFIQNQNRKPGSIFDVVYDLKKQDFYHSHQKKLDAWVVSLSSLFCYEEYVKIKRNLMEEFGRELYGRYLYLYNVFQGYKIPVTIIVDRSPVEVADIFIKINRQGQRLSPSDFKEAIGWIKEHEE